MKQTRTTFLTAPRTIELAAQEPLRPGPGEVVVELRAVGVCGSDVHWYVEGHIGDLAATEPLTLGHEPAGVVTAVGEGADPGLLGRRVAIEPAIHCGHCIFCREGNTNICPNILFMGNPPTQGAFREALVHPAHLVAPLPDTISDEVGALLEPLAIGLHTMDLLKPRLGATFVIAGAGPVGLSALLATRLLAPEKLIVVEPLGYRRELARSLGADLVFSPDDPDAADDIKRATGGWGARYVIEAVGTRDSFDRMIHYAEPGAKVAVIGIEANDDFGCNDSLARRKGLTFLMVRRSRHTLERAIRITAAGHWHPEAMITHRRGLAGLSSALDLLAEYDDGVVKAMIDPQR
ncbi:MAG: alcohol dehydrogenase catalytic domain-containing protein [bacterium]|nr:alcohol dehydrogenase catalytic domain-containing protein [bacterium]